MDSAGKPQQTVDLQKLMQMQFSFAPYFVMSTSLQLRFFSHIAAGHKTSAAIARAAGSSERGTRMLLDMLSVLEVLEKKHDEYSLAPFTARYLVRESPEYLGFIMESGSHAEAWRHLPECVRTGKPYRPVNQQKDAEQFFPTLVRGLHVSGREPARRLAEALGAGKTHHGLKVIDIACGSGVWGIAVAEADRESRVTAQDFPGLLPVTKEFLEQHGVTPQYDFLPGDLKQVDFGDSRYDLALLGNIVHSEGEPSTRELFRRLRRALKPNGRIAIVEMVPNDQRTGPPFPILFAINMLVNTEEGDTYTLAEYTAWLADAGFGRIETADIGSHSPAIIATRA